MESLASGAARRIPKVSPVPHPEIEASARPEGATLAEHHGEYLEVRAVREGTPGRAMFWTARRPSQIPAAFSTRQRRSGEALIAEFLSPDGVTRGWQMRPDRARRNRAGKIVKWMSPPAERARMVLGVVPEMLEAVRSGTAPLWACEGLTRGAALAPYGIPAVSYAGCWNWQKDGEALECWEHVSLSGRLVYDVPDADYRTNENVQKALAERVRYLESRGARVLVVSVPDINGDPNAGLDDYLATGGSLEELERSARPFKPVDVAGERMSRDEELAAAVSACQRHLEEMPANSRAACSNRAAFRDLLRQGERIGKVEPEGLLVVRSSLDGAAGSRMSERAWWKAIERMEAAGDLRRAKWGPDKDRAGAYLLTPSRGGRAFRAHYRGEASRGDGQEKGTERDREVFPLTYAERNNSVHETRGPENLKKPETVPEVPALRWPKVVHTWSRRNGRRVVVDSDYIARIGKQGEEVIRYVLEQGPTSVAELMVEFGSKKVQRRDFVRRRLRPLEGWGIVSLDGEEVRLTPGWREALERERKLRDEILDNRLQAERAERRKLERREHFARVRRGEIPKADKTPRLRGKEHNRRTIERHSDLWKRERVEAERQKAGTTAAVFLADELAGVAGVRFRDLRERWIMRGGRGEDLQRAVQDPLSPFRFDREEADGGALYVYAGAESRKQSHASAAVLPLRPEVTGQEAKKEGPDERISKYSPPKKEPIKINGVHFHGPECGCWLCEDEPSYAGAPA